MYDHRVYEILAKWIAKNQEVTISMEKDCVPQANVETKHIRLPYNIKEEHIFPALALLMHESSHIKRTNYNVEGIMGSGSMEHFRVLNGVEDGRIDLLNFGMLPNVKEFYRGLYTKERLMECINSGDEVHAKLAPCMWSYLEMKSLVPQKHKPKHELMDAFSDLASLLSDLENAIKSLKWSRPVDMESVLSHRYGECADKFKQLCRLLGLPDPPPPDKEAQKVKNQQGQGQGQGQSQGDQGDDQGQGKDGNDQEGEGQGDDNSNVNDLAKGGGIFDKAKQEIFKPSDKYTLSEKEMPLISFREQTKEAFKQILDQKIQKKEYNGRKLNSDSLTSFFTGDVEELFIDDTIDVRRKAKVLFLVDRSGSMYQPMIDGNQKSNMIADVMQNILNIMKEVRDQEGQELEYRVAVFNHDVEEIEPDKFQESFSAGGGTWLSRAVQWGIDEISKEDNSVGARVVVLMTDGEVASHQVEHIKMSLLTVPSEIRFVLLGIGCDIAGGFVKQIIGQERNVMIKDHCEQSIMNAVIDALQ